MRVARSMTVARYSQPSPVLRVGDVTNEPGARPLGGEVPADQVRTSRRLFAGQGGAFTGARLAHLQSDSRIRSATRPTLHAMPSRLSAAATRRQP
jgi:hypothetical protein